MKSNFKSIFFIIVLLTFNQAFANNNKSLRIVSLVPSFTNIIDALGEGKSIVGRTSFCDTSGNVKGEIVASAISVNIEKVLLLKPDYIITSGLVKPETQSKFKKLGLKVKNYNYPKSLKEINEQFIDIAKLFNKEKFAKEIISNTYIELNALKKSLPKKDNPLKIFIQIGKNPIWTTPKNTFMSEYFDWVNAINVANDLTYGSVSREQVLIWNPDYIFITTMGGIDQSEKSNWMKYKHITASKKNQIYILNSNKACSPNPLTFLETVKDIANIIKKND